jgi:hypothetical protein
MSESNGNETPTPGEGALPAGALFVITVTRLETGQLKWTTEPKIDNPSVVEYALREAADYLAGNRLARQNMLLMQQIAQERQQAEFAKRVMGGQRMGGPGLIQP